MPDVALAGLGTIVFALTTWASLAFGYQVFQDRWDADQATSHDPASHDPAPAQEKDRHE